MRIGVIAVGRRIPPEFRPAFVEIALRRRTRDADAAHAVADEGKRMLDHRA